MSRVVHIAVTYLNSNETMQPYCQELTVAKDVRQPGQDDISLWAGQAGHAGLDVLLTADGLASQELCCCPQHLAPIPVQACLLCWTSCKTTLSGHRPCQKGAGMIRVRCRTMPHKAHEMS